MTCSIKLQYGLDRSYVTREAANRFRYNVNVSVGIHPYRRLSLPFWNWTFLAEIQRIYLQTHAVSHAQSASFDYCGTAIKDSQSLIEARYFVTKFHTRINFWHHRNSRCSTNAVFYIFQQSRRQRFFRKNFELVNFYTFNERNIRKHRICTFCTFHRYKALWEIEKFSFWKVDTALLFNIGLH